jgi:hypothetical protein
VLPLVSAELAAFEKGGKESSNSSTSSSSPSSYDSNGLFLEPVGDESRDVATVCLLMLIIARRRGLKRKEDASIFL